MLCSKGEAMVEEMTMSPEVEERVAQLLEKSLEVFFSDERDNIKNDTSERNLCARLGMCLNAELPKHGLGDYYVDPEYNRKQDGRVKTMVNGRGVVVNICCDLIVHSRGQLVAADNLIAVEMKKSNRNDIDKQSDRDRLIALTKVSYDDVWSADGKTHPEHVCGYLIGVYVELNPESGEARV